MKKKTIIGLASIALLSVSLGTTEIAFNNNSSEAAIVNTVKKGKRAKLTHNAYVYNYKGKRVKTKTLKKDATFKILSIKKIHGKEYARIGHNRYVKVANFRTNKSLNENGSSTAKLTHNSYIYNASGDRVGKKVLKKGKIINYLATITIDGNKYVQIGKNQFVKDVNVSSTITTSIPDESSNVPEKKINN